MFAVIFVVQPKAGLTDRYLEFAKVLKPELERIDGFVDNERFASRRHADRVVSLSTWRDEKAVIRWRTLAIHHAAQARGRFEIFAHYHLRVGEITADTDIPEGHALRDQRLDETEIGAGKAITLSEIVRSGTPRDAEPVLPDAGTAGLVDHESFDSIYDPEKSLLLASWRSRAAADNWRPNMAAPARLRHRCVRVVRDYGMEDRREAPQYYEPVRRDGVPA